MGSDAICPGLFVVLYKLEMFISLHCIFIHNYHGHLCTTSSSLGSLGTRAFPASATYRRVINCAWVNTLINYAPVRSASGEGLGSEASIRLFFI